jgi:hypothetical protein
VEDAALEAVREGLRLPASAVVLAAFGSEAVDGWRRVERRGGPGGRDARVGARARPGAQAHACVERAKPEQVAHVAPDPLDLRAAIDGETARGGEQRLGQVQPGHPVPEPRQLHRVAAETAAELEHARARGKAQRAIREGGIRRLHRRVEGLFVQLPATVVEQILVPVRQGGLATGWWVGTTPAYSTMIRDATRALIPLARPGACSVAATRPRVD